MLGDADGDTLGAADVGDALGAADGDALGAEGDALGEGVGHSFGQWPVMPGLLSLFVM